MPDPENYIGRGVAIYINNQLVAQEMKAEKYDNIEVISVGIKLKNTDWLLIQCAYRSPSSSGNYMHYRGC